MRVELAEAIYRDDGKGKREKKQKKRGGGVVDDYDDDAPGFAVGVRRVMVLPRTTTIAELLKRSKSKLNIRGRNPTRVFAMREEEEVGGGGGGGLGGRGGASSLREFDLDRDLSDVDDGTVLYVSSSSTARGGRVSRPDDGDAEGDGDETPDHRGSEEGRDDDDDDDDGSTPAVVVEDPLDSVKRAYRRRREGVAKRDDDDEGRRRRRRHRETAPDCEEEVVDVVRRLSHAPARRRLPISSHRERIVRAVRENGVVILSGSTGSGKSTQVPQFLLEEEEEEEDKEEDEEEEDKEEDDPIDGGGGGGDDRRRPLYGISERRRRRRRRRPYIVVTEPRRIAAVSLAHRVAEERGCPPPGAPGSVVGYMVRNDRQVHFPSCRIIYMTIGILLRMLVSDRRGTAAAADDDDDDDEGHGGAVVPPLSIDTISHLIIDETHERDVNTDFSLTLLRGLLSSSSCPGGGVVPRLILMSATASSELFLSYFGRPNGLVVPSVAIIDVPGTTFPVECRWLSDCEEYAGWKMIRRRGDGGEGDRGGDSGDDSNVRRPPDSSERKPGGGNGGGGGAIELSPRALEKIDDVFIRSLIAKIINERLLSDRRFARDGANDAARDDGRTMGGAILVFLPGAWEIESLARCLLDGGAMSEIRDLCTIVKLHSTIPKSDQRRAFLSVSAGRVKIVLSTNIAEVRLLRAEPLSVSPPSNIFHEIQMLTLLSTSSLPQSSRTNRLP